jgi:predicted Zn-dependent peptidase
MLDCTRERLPNGLRVIHVRMASFHSAIAMVFLRMGPRFESREDNGLSHFVEHVLFKGSERYPNSDAISREIDALGAELNGATMPEYTELLVSCHTRHFRRGLEMLADIVTRPRFAPDHVEAERRVVLEEMGQFRDMPGEGVSVDELAYELMWPTRAYSFNSLGRAESVAQFTRDQTEEHYRRFLKANNMVVCIAGNYDPGTVSDVLARSFGALDGGEAATSAPLEDAQDSARHTFRRMPTQMAYVKLCHKACSYHDPRLYRVLVISDILGGGVTSRLFSRLRERDGLVYDVSANTTLFSDCGSVDIATTTSKDKAAATLEATLEEIQRLTDDGIQEGYLQSIKDRVACHMEILEDSPPEVADWLGVRELLLSPERLVTPSEEATRLNDVTVAEIRTVAQDVFRASHRSLVVAGRTSWTQRRRIRRAAKG